MKNTPRFSKQTLAFILKAHRQKKPEWLDKNREQYEELLLLPLQNLARYLKTRLGSAAPGYHFPQKGIGRLKRPSNRVAQGGGLYKDWMAYSASVPSGSLFDGNPNLFFLLNPGDKNDPVLVAGGLYMPSSRQTRSIREALAQDTSAFERLFASKDFKASFKGGFAREKVSSRPPRGFDPNHPKLDWLKLQAFYVWKPYRLKDFESPSFPKIVERDFRQILRLNELLTQAIQGKVQSHVPKSKAKPARLLERLTAFDGVERKMDF